jgi:signal transduction histidine kinase
MQRLVDVTLDYLRGLKEAEAIHPVDVNGLAGGLADDFAATGHPIEVAGRAESPFEGRPLALRRALTNLLENALTYGGKATLRIEDGPASLRLIAEDEGPGIPEADLARVLEPFERLDQSRGRGTGGFGLGCPSPGTSPRATAGHYGSRTAHRAVCAQSWVAASRAAVRAPHGQPTRHEVRAAA